MAEITINGQNYPIHFGLRAIDHFAIMRNIEFSEILTAKNALVSFDSIVELAQIGLNEGAERAGSDHRFTKDELWAAFEEEPELLIIVSEMFVESITPLMERMDRYSKNSKRPTRIRRAK